MFDQKLNPMMMQPKLVVKRPLALDAERRQYEMFVTLGEKGTSFSITVKYMLGGHNWWTYKTDPRGIFLGITPMKYAVTEGGGIAVREYTMFSGIRILLEELNRYSSKKLDSWSAEIFGTYPDGELDPRVYELLKDVCEKNNIVYEAKSPYFGEN